MKPRIDSLFVAFKSLLSDFKPEDSSRVRELLQVAIADKMSPGIYIFNIKIESIASLSARLDGALYLNHSIVFDRFNSREIEEYVQRAIDGFEGDTWDDFIDYFSFFGLFEASDLPSLLR